MSYDPSATIAAIATPLGGAARGIVRLSGPRSLAVAADCFQASHTPSLDALRRATAVSGHLPLPIDTAPVRQVPCDLFVWPTNRSYSGEPVVEFHTLGSPPVLEALLAMVCRAGARIAEPGEFTLRAFLAGRIDLTQAEAVLGVVDARQAAELNVALGQLAGGLARPLHELRDELLQLLAELEAGLDFVDEDIEFVSASEVQQRLVAAERRIAAVAQQMAARRTAVSAHRVALVGPPNAGKSSLFNALVSQFGAARAGSIERVQPALVSSIRGTTRDYLTATIELDGLPCELIDTAGIDAASALLEIEAASQSIAKQQQSSATLRVWCIEALELLNSRNPMDIRSQSTDPSDQDILAATKADLAPSELRDTATATGANVVTTSSVTGEGILALGGLLRTRLTAMLPATNGQVVAATADRCSESVRRAHAALVRAIQLTATGGFGDELLAVEIRTALDELGKVIGAVYTDDLLDRIFKTFCIGK